MTCVKKRKWPIKDMNRREASSKTNMTAYVDNSELYRKVRCVINKITPTNFQRQAKQLNEICTCIKTLDMFNGLANLIFEAAIRQPKFAVAYASLCRSLAIFKVADTTKQGEFVNFRAILLNRCQREFENIITQSEQTVSSKDHINQQESTMDDLDKSKKRSLGLIRFIGELFMLKMFTENIMHDCIYKLLVGWNEDLLECACTLLSITGKELDTDKAKPRMDKHFNRMEQIVICRKTSSKLRFTLQDIIDLRKNKWVPRKHENKPEILDQIRKEIPKGEQKRRWDKRSDSRDSLKNPLMANNPTRAQEVILCHLCEEHPSLLHCNPCKVNLCEGCVGKHYVTSSSYTHEVVKLRFRKSQLLFPKCNAHTEILSLKCQNCDENVCIKCLVGAHNGHKVAEISTIVEEKRRLIEQNTAYLLDDVLPNLMKTDSEIESKILLLNTECNKLENLLTKHGKEWHEIIDECIKENRENVCRIREIGIKYMKSHREEIRNSLSHLQMIVQQNRTIIRSLDINEVTNYSSETPESLDIPSDINIKLPKFQFNSPDKDRLHQEIGELKTTDIKIGPVFLAKPSHSAVLASRQTTPHQGSSINSSQGGTLGQEPYIVDIEKSSTSPNAAKELSKEAIEKKAKAIIEEYLDVQDMKEAILSVEDLKSPTLMHVFVSSAVNNILEKSSIAWNQTGLLFHDLVKKGVLAVPMYIKGLTEIVHFAEDLEIDIPNVWKYFGELIGQMVEDGGIPLKVLLDVAAPLKENNKARLLVAEVLHHASHREGYKKIGSLWKQSTLKWEDFMPAAHVEQFIKDKALGEAHV